MIRWLKSAREFQESDQQAKYANIYIKLCAGEEHLTLGQ